MKNIITASILFIFSCVANGYCNNTQVPADLESRILALSDSEAHQLFSQAVARQKRLLPKKVNSYIDWIDITIEDKQLFNVYFIDKERLNIPLAVALAELKKKGKARIVRKVKSAPIILLMAKRGYKIVYLYFDKDDNLLHRFDIHQDDLR